MSACHRHGRAGRNCWFDRDCDRHPVLIPFLRTLSKVASFIEPCRKIAPYPLWILELFFQCGTSRYFSACLYFQASRTTLGFNRADLSPESHPSVGFHFKALFLLLARDYLMFWPMPFICAFCLPSRFIRYVVQMADCRFFSNVTFCRTLPDKWQSIIRRLYL